MTSRKPAYPAKTVAAFLAYAGRHPEAILPAHWRTDEPRDEGRHELPDRAVHPAGGRRPGLELTAADGTPEAPLPTAEADDR